MLESFKELEIKHNLPKKNKRQYSYIIIRLDNSCRLGGARSEPNLCEDFSSVKFSSGKTLSR